MRRFITIIVATLVLVLMLSAAAIGGDGDTGTNIKETSEGLVVTAGTPGSLRVTSTPGQPGRGPTIYCGWYRAIVDGFLVHLEPIVPQLNETQVLNCWTDDPNEPYPGYPKIVTYRGRAEIAGSAVSSADAAQFAVSRLGFKLPEIRLSPPRQQVVGVPTWFAVTSQLHYQDVSANAGPVWATVRALFRDVTWDLGNDEPKLRCKSDVAKVWNPKGNRAQSSACSHTYISDKGAPLNIKATVRWDIWQRNNTNPTWHRWGTISRSSKVSVPVTQLQAAIR